MDNTIHPGTPSDALYIQFLPLRISIHGRMAGGNNPFEIMRDAYLFSDRLVGTRVGLGHQSFDVLA